MQRMLLLLIALPCLPAQQPTPTSLRDACVAAAGTIESIDYGEFLYGRHRRSHGKSIGIRHGPGLDALATLGERPATRTELRALLGDHDARVRTLGAMLAFDCEDPVMLPMVAILLNDAAPTFASAMREIGRAMDFGTLSEGRIPAPAYRTHPMTVREVVESLLRFPIQFTRARATVDTATDFANYWERRATRAHFVSWTLFRLARATGGITPIRWPVHERVRIVRTAVDALPSPDRELAILGIPDHDGVFSTHAERIAAAQQLGAQTVLEMLDGRYPTDDPDLPLLFGDSGVFQSDCPGRRFVLANASSVLPRDTGPKLLELETKQRETTGKTSGFVDTGFVIAAADLTPDRAQEWLVAAFERFGPDGMQRGELLVALHRHADDAAIQTIAERFYETGKYPAMFTGITRSPLCQALAQARNTKARKTLDALIAHPGFATADAETLSEIATVVRAFTAMSALPDVTTQQVHHPLGIAHLRTPEAVEKAKQGYPVETERFLAMLSWWREQLLASRDEWSIHRRPR
jgi:hypothetical protein